MNPNETIFATATGRLPSGIAIMRVSGPGARQALVSLAGVLPEPRRATYTNFVFEGEILDSGIALYFPGPRSVTGEDCAEFHLHGSVGVAKALAAALSNFAGFRLAEPGEFTRRAFLNGRMDLTGVESLSDLIAAETDQQRRLALSGVSGRIRDICLGWRGELQSLRARIEADLDFADQDDVASHGPATLGVEVGSLIERMSDTASRSGQAEMIRDGFRVAIVGAPNAGKSSLLNALAMRDVAIVTAEPGTTRDVLEVSLDIGGYKVVLCDTAGIREGDALAERMGIARALESAKDADLVLMIEDSANPVPVMIETEAEIVAIGAKSDLMSRPVRNYDLCISARSGAGLGDLVTLIAGKIEGAARNRADLLPLRDRHVAHICRAVEALARIDAVGLPEMIAEELRVAAMEIGRVVGIGDTEDLLGEIFSRFCIGK